MLILIFLFNFLVLYLKFCNADGTYSIMAPKVIRPGEPYKAIIAIQDANKGTEVNCTLKQYKLGLGKLDQPVVSINFTQMNDVENIKFCTLNIDYARTEGLYEVMFEGKGGIVFNYTLNLEYIKNQFIILVQTDKAIYKPDQDVMFRVIILNQYLKPINEVENKDIKIHIMDPLENKLSTFISSSIQESGIKNTNQFKVNEGVTGDLTFKLHQNVMLGKWNIRVTINEQVQDYQFFVNNYYLPLANVTINLPEFHTFSDSLLNVTINCFYTFGKPVTGQLQLNISMHKSCVGSNSRFEDISIKNINITGQVKQNLDISKFLEERCSLIMLKFTALIQDKFTNSTYEEVDLLKVTNKIITVEHEVPHSFKPGQLVEIKSIVKQQTQNPDIELMFKLTCRANITSKTNIVQNTRLLDSKHKENEIICRYYTNKDTAYLKHELMYNEESLDTVEIKAITNCQNITVQIFLKEPKFQIKPDDEIELEVTSTEPFISVIYYVVIRGSIIDSKMLKNEKNSTSHTFIQKIWNSMVPEVSFVIYYATKNGYLASDHLTLKVVGLLSKNVKISVTTPVLNAGERANFSVEADEESNVYLLAVDESLLALKQGNDIFESRVLQQLLDLPQVEGTNGWYYETNGKKECAGSEYYSNEYDPSDNKNVNSDKMIRQDLRETWMFDRVQMKKRRKVNLWDIVPDSITSWKITAFSIHKFEGLSLIEDPAYVTVNRQFFLKLNLPFKMIKLETAEIHILLFSYLIDTSSVSLNVYSTKNENIKFKNCSQVFTLHPNEIKQITCDLTPTETDIFKITAVANATTLINKTVFSDGEEKDLYVAFEGHEIEVEKPVLFEVDGTEPVFEKSEIDLPAGFVDGSLRTYITATSQMISNTTTVSLIDTIKNSKFEPIFNKPHGCCEQRNADFFPMVYLLDYLSNTKQLKLADQNNAIQSMIQHISMLCFHNPNDGSFVSYNHVNDGWQDGGTPTFVSQNILPSVWQTANVLKLLFYAQKYLNVEKSIISRAVDWLMNVQQPDGSYVEIEKTSIVSTQNMDAYLTSFVYIAMNLHGFPNQDAVAYLEKNFDRYYKSLDTLDIIISCYVLHLANSDLQEDCYVKVLKLSVYNSEKNITTWMGSDDETTSAYALMLLSHKKEKFLGMEIFKKLISFRNSRGGFRNTHSTAICTESLSMFVSLLKQFNVNDENVNIDFNFKNGHNRLNVSPKYGNIQTNIIDNRTLTVNLTATGRGRAIASVIWMYNVKDIPGLEFDVNSKVNEGINGVINLDVCTKRKLNGTSTNVMTEIDLPTGYKFIGFKFDTQNYNVARIDMKNDNTHIDLYINQLNTDKLCIKVETIQTHKVGNLIPGSITAYNYYNSKNPTLVQYHAFEDY